MPPVDREPKIAVFGLLSFEKQRNVNGDEDGEDDDDDKVDEAMIESL